jgi:hypothetical protein
VKSVRCESLEELDAVIKEVGPDALYRGQVSHYERKDGVLSLTTSFARHGCIPPLMIKWLHYAHQILMVYVRGRDDTRDMPTDQAILQHYGWRSFFLDATGNARVAAWFASNTYKTRTAINLVEDCFEDPVFLISEVASFEQSESMGHLYVISRKMLRHARINAVHLSEIATNTGSPRYVRQDAYMVGPVAQEGLAADCVTHHITAPSTVLAAYADGLSCQVLFPNRSEDPILDELLSMPWEKADRSAEGIDFFRRSLPLPEYDPPLVKHMPPSAAMYRPFWLKDLSQNPTSISHVLCSDGLYHGSSTVTFTLPHLTALLSDCDGVHVEPRGLVYHGMAPLYGKGILVMRKDINLVHVSEIGIEHPGLKIGQIGKFPGIHYRVDETCTWHRIEHPENCDCGDSHEDHIALLGRVDTGLVEDRFNRQDENVYAEKGVDLHSDSAITKWDDGL